MSQTNEADARSVSVSAEDRGNIQGLAERLASVLAKEGEGVLVVISSQKSCEFQGHGIKPFEFFMISSVLSNWSNEYGAIIVKEYCEKHGLDPDNLPERGTDLPLELRAALGAPESELIVTEVANG